MLKISNKGNVVDSTIFIQIEKSVPLIHTRGKSLFPQSNSQEVRFPNKTFKLHKSSYFYLFSIKTISKIVNYI